MGRCNKRRSIYNKKLTRIGGLRRKQLEEKSVDFVQISRHSCYKLPLSKTWFDTNVFNTFELAQFLFIETEALRWTNNDEPSPTDLISR
jgi:hypothetical protein